MGKGSLTYFEVKLAALILKKVALDSAATALAFKIRRVNMLVQHPDFLKAATYDHRSTRCVM